MQALAEGKQIQCRAFPDYQNWVDISNPDFSCSANHYRIKPELKRLYAVYEKDNLCEIYTELCKAKQWIYDFKPSTHNCVIITFEETKN